MPHILEGALEPMPANRQPSPVSIAEPKPLLTQLAAKDAVLLHQIRDRLPLVAIQPAGEDGEQDVEGRRVDHPGVYNYNRVGDVGRVVGQYALLVLRTNELGPRMSAQMFG